MAGQAQGGRGAHRVYFRRGGGVRGQLRLTLAVTLRVSYAHPSRNPNQEGPQVKALRRVAP